MSTQTTLYVAYADRRLRAPGMPDLVPGVDPPDPPDPPSNPLLAFGTTLYGQSFARFKEPTLGSGAPRYNAAEDDLRATLGGVARRGGAVVRVYNDDNNGPETWAQAHPAYIRDGQPVIYSWKYAAGASETTVKNGMRAFLDSKDPDTTEFAWLINWHEPDDNIVDGNLTLTQWCNQNTWIREVIDEPAYQDRTDFRFGMCTTGTLWNKGTQADDPRGWRTYYNAQRTNAGGRTDVWDFMGGDRYNPGWKGPTRYITVADWIRRKDEMHNELGLPFVVGEAGSARAQVNTSVGWTIEQQDVQRSTWIRDLFTKIRSQGYFDAASWWRVPALAKGGGISGAFSTIMVTRPGYNAQLTAAGITPPPGGTDALSVIDVLSEFCQQSILDAVPPTGLPAPTFYVP